MRKYKCPYCEYSYTRDRLVNHIESKHDEVIPKDMSASRIVFNLINNKTHGVCVVCKKKTSWNEKAGKYNRLCDDPKCREHLRKIAQENMLRVHHMTSKEMLNNPEHQAKMLANRKISGEYKFRDGGVRTYTGTFEHKALEFFDKVLEVDSKDIMTPGPTLTYTYNGERHVWITDIYYIPHNLIIEVKDGGDNPNNRTMVSYREKQVAKEKMITNLGTYNYLRLTNNNFGQLLEILAELKARAIDDSDDNMRALIKINESMAITAGTIPPANAHDAYVVAYGYDNAHKTFADEDDEIEGFALTDDIISDNIIIQKDDKLVKESFDKFLENRSFNIYKYKGSKVPYKKILKKCINKISVSENYIYKELSNKDMYSVDQINYDPVFEEANISAIGFLETAILDEINSYEKYNDFMVPVLGGNIDNNIIIKESVSGYVAIDTINGNRTPIVENVNDIDEDTIDILKSLR